MGAIYIQIASKVLEKFRIIRPSTRNLNICFSFQISMKSSSIDIVTECISTVRRIFQEIGKNSEMFKSKSVQFWPIDSIFLFVKEEVANILLLIIFSKRYQ